MVLMIVIGCKFKLWKTLLHSDFCLYFCLDTAKALFSMKDRILEILIFCRELIEIEMNDESYQWF